MAMFLQLIWFDPGLLQDVGDYNYCLGWYLFFNLDRRRSELPKSHRGCWSLWWGHLKFFFSIISFLKTNVIWCNLISYSALFGILWNAEANLYQVVQPATIKWNTRMRVQSGFHTLVYPSMKWLGNGDKQIIIRGCSHL